MKNIAEQILEGLSKFYVGFQNRRVLKTMEEIESVVSVNIQPLF